MSINLQYPNVFQTWREHRSSPKNLPHQAQKKHECRIIKSLNLQRQLAPNQRFRTGATKGNHEAVEIGLRDTVPRMNYSGSAV